MFLTPTSWFSCRHCLRTKESPTSSLLSVAEQALGRAPNSSDEDLLDALWQQDFGEEHFGSHDFGHHDRVNAARFNDIEAKFDEMCIFPLWEKINHWSFLQLGELCKTVAFLLPKDCKQSQGQKSFAEKPLLGGPAQWVQGQLTPWWAWLRARGFASSQWLVPHFSEAGSLQLPQSRGRWGLKWSWNRPCSF